MGGMRSAWLFAACVCIFTCHVVVGEAEDGGETASKGEKPTFSNQGLKPPRIDMGLLNRMNKLAPPNPAVWPSGFEVQFYTNVTGSDVQDPGAWPPGALKGTLWFGDKRGQRILHAAGSTECMKFYHTDKECSLVFNKLGLFAILPPQELGSEGVQVPAEPRCCLDMPGLLSPAADWVTVAAHEWFMTKHIRGRLCHGNHP
ncbi:hypothetical protein T484DRAFT_1777137 [Baffinella frigidus]|nr:hypothetical protein T484DRAFT_1777137 [Cryptophyta sp. CCMP2293]